MTPELPSSAPAAHGQCTGAQGVQVSTTELAQLLRFDLAGYANADAASFTTRRIGEGETLYRAGDEFHSLYVVRSGFFKTLMLDPSGAEQVLAFPMTADVMGADGIASGRYTSEAIALEASEVVVVPFARISALARECPPLERVLYRVLSRELVREQGMLYVVGMLGAEGRVAAFLLNLGERFGALGYSRTSFNLRMTRQEIGSLLGLKLETVSRALSAFDAAGFIKVNLKRVDIVDAGALRAMMEEPIAPVLRSGAARVRSSGPSGLVGNGLKPSSLPA